MIIGFTGHRNRTTSQSVLDSIAADFPDATWLHGGAIGFDTQVSDYANAHGIDVESALPDYQRYGRGAPLVRNKSIAEKCDLLCACWDGRKTGGTFYTIQLARKLNKPLRLAGIQE